MSKPTPAPSQSTSITSSPLAYETRHVHAVYDEIATHFSQTRYKPWPIVSRFLKALPPGSVGLDVGCGNGKYMAENGHVVMLGSDMSEPLLRLARTNMTSDNPSDGQRSINSFVVASTLQLPHPDSRFDFSICIAVIHHLSTPERRIDGVRQILACLKTDSGKALIYVWALEQKGSRRGWDEGDDQDVMVPWVLKQNGSSKTQKQKQKPMADCGGNFHAANSIDGETMDPQNDSTNEPKVYQRYYHLYRKGELEDDIVTAGGKVLEAGYEKDNWWVIASRSS